MLEVLFSEVASILMPINALTLIQALTMAPKVPDFLAGFSGNASRPVS